MGGDKDGTILATRVIVYCFGITVTMMGNYGADDMWGREPVYWDGDRVKSLTISIDGDKLFLAHLVSWLTINRLIINRLIFTGGIYYASDR